VSESVETLFGTGSNYLVDNDYRWSSVMALRNPVIAIVQIGPVRTLASFGSPLMPTIAIILFAKPSGRLT
jgi:hypothetical protein